MDTRDGWNKIDFMTKAIAGNVGDDDINFHSLTIPGPNKIVEPFGGVKSPFLFRSYARANSPHPGGTQCVSGGIFYTLRLFY